MMAQRIIVSPRDALLEEATVRIIREAVWEFYGFDDAAMDSLTPVADIYQRFRWRKREMIAEPNVDVDHP